MAGLAALCATSIPEARVGILGIKGNCLCFSRSFSRQHREKRWIKKHGKLHRTLKFDAIHSATVVRKTKHCRDIGRNDKTTE